MKLFTFAGEHTSTTGEWLKDGLRQGLTEKGCTFIEQPEDNLRLAFNFFKADNPRPFRRRGQATFVVGVVEVDEKPDDVLKAGYPLMIRSLSNLLLFLINTGGKLETHFITLEQGSYKIDADPGDEEEYFASLMERLTPLAFSQLVIDNEFRTDLPEEVWDGDEISEQLRDAGRRLDDLDLLPAAFPIQDILPERDYRHVQRLYGLGGLSYGNLSARRDETSFWMSASGVDKGNLQRVGEDILLVTGYDPEKNTMILSVPPNRQHRRVSVDAIEHYMIYKEHPEVGAIVHVHAWMDGIASTQVNYPCGTLQLAEAVAELVRREPDPSRAVVGLRNHGLTITGPSLADIFDRIEGNIIRQVPMT